MLCEGFGRGWDGEWNAGGFPVQRGRAPMVKEREETGRQGVGRQERRKDHRKGWRGRNARRAEGIEVWEHGGGAVEEHKSGEEMK